MDETMYYNVEEVACNFYDWLVSNGYCDKDDKMEDIDDMVKDFYKIQDEAPKLFNLLRVLSN